MTNYFHLLHAGHYSYFLLRYGNMYRYSQQGWENLNGRLKRIFHHNTQKGGGRGGSSKFLPVVYTLAREMLWRFGYLDGLFKHLGHDGELNIEYGKVKPMPKEKYAKAADIEAFTQTLFKFVSVEAFEEPTECELDTIGEVDEGSA